MQRQSATCFARLMVNLKFLCLIHNDCKVGGEGGILLQGRACCVCLPEVSRRRRELVGSRQYEQNQDALRRCRPPMSWGDVFSNLDKEGARSAQFRPLECAQVLISRKVLIRLLQLVSHYVNHALYGG